MSNETELSDAEAYDLWLSVWDGMFTTTLCKDGSEVVRKIAAAFAKRDAAVKPHLRTPDGKIILFPCGSNVLLVDDDGMELVSVYSGKHTRYLDVYEQSFVRAALNSNTHPNTDDCRSYC